eukprot:tig00000448_g923.t1
MDGEFQDSGKGNSRRLPMLPLPLPGVAADPEELKKELGGDGMASRALPRSESGTSGRRTRRASRGRVRVQKQVSREWSSVVTGLHDVEALFWQSHRAKSAPRVALASALTAAAAWLAAAFFVASAWGAEGVTERARAGATASSGAAALLCTALAALAWRAGTSRRLRAHQHAFAAALAAVLHAWTLYIFCGAFVNAGAVPAALALLGPLAASGLRCRFFVCGALSGLSVLAFTVAYAAAPELRAADPPAALSVLLAWAGLAGTLHHAFEAEARARHAFMVEEGLAGRWIAPQPEAPEAAPSDSALSPAPDPGPRPTAAGAQ